ncbi:ABC-three component system protein [Phreatobacter cathodiphilus]|uniref:ABC-three component system protein n=1 Tax=Phreatobacter cathodiphilus TaxID=1868589 RepID=UPI0011B227AB|nr:ABC-three component system protein [Phreatobacter cathodiphilus]
MTSGSSGKAVVQSGNHAGGHIAGGSVSTVSIRKVIVQASTPPESSLNRLYRKLRDEAAHDQELTDYIDQLQIFTRSVEHETIVGLDGKFTAANRQDQLDMAKVMKEMVYAELRKNMFSKTFQTIYATLMGKIYEEFETWVKPAVAKGASREDIDLLVNVHVVKPVVSELEMCSEYDGAATSTVRGMIYFLTGNCHLIWH